MWGGEMGDHTGHDGVAKVTKLTIKVKHNVLYPGGS